MGTGANGFAGPGGAGYQGTPALYSLASEHVLNQTSRPIRRCACAAASTASGIRSAKCDDISSTTNGHARLPAYTGRSVWWRRDTATASGHGLWNANASATTAWLPARPADGIPSTTIRNADGNDDGWANGHAASASHDGSQRFADAAKIAMKRSGTRENGFHVGRHVSLTIVVQLVRIA